MMSEKTPRLIREEKTIKKHGSTIFYVCGCKTRERCHVPRVVACTRQQILNAQYLFAAPLETATRKAKKKDKKLVLTCW